MNAIGRLTISEAAKFLGYSQIHLRKLSRNGQVPAKKRRGKWFFEKDSLAALFEGNGYEQNKYKPSERGIDDGTNKTSETEETITENSGMLS